MYSDRKENILSTVHYRQWYCTGFYVVMQGVTGFKPTNPAFSANVLLRLLTFILLGTIVGDVLHPPPGMYKIRTKDLCCRCAYLCHFTTVMLQITSAETICCNLVNIVTLFSSTSYY